MGIDLVTGASGFIGQHLAHRLIAQGRQARLLCRPGSERKLSPEVARGSQIARGDLRDPASLEAAARGAERVFHCAGHVSDWGTEEEFFATNVEGTRNLLAAARAGGVSRFIHLSSIAAFGTPSPEYFDDATAYGESRDGYSRTKAEGERVVFEFHEKHGLPFTILRPAVVYGFGGTWLEEPLKMIEEGKMFLLGGGVGTCHPCYIENLVDAILLASEHPRALGRAYIVSDGESVSFREFFNAVARVAGKAPIGRSIPLPVAHAIAAFCEAKARLTRSTSRPLLTRTAIEMVTTRSQMSAGRISAELGFKPRYDFRAAIEELAGEYGGRERLSGALGL